MQEAVTLTSFQIAILDTLRGIARTYGKRYAFPTQETILEKVREYHGLKRARSSLNYALKDLEEKKLIHRVRRTRAGRFTSTAYYVLDRSKSAAARSVRRLIGQAKRLGRVFSAVRPNRVQLIGHNQVPENRQGYGRLEGGGPFEGLTPLRELLKGFKPPWES